MIKYAIVGNIASGKSEVEKLIERKGFAVFDTDLMVHDILIDKPEISEAFKEDDVFEFGRLSREKLSKLVFNDDEKRKKLEELVYPFLIDELNNIFKTYSKEEFIFVSVPLLYEKGFEKLFDRVVYVASDENIRLERLIKRNNITKEDALKRINSQLKDEEKMNKADYIIYNNADYTNLLREVDKFLDTIRH